MEKISRRRQLIASGILLAGSLFLSGCGDDVASPAEDSVPPALSAYDVDVENDPELENYEIVRLAGFEPENLDNAYSVTFQESYDYQGYRWICSLTITDNAFGQGAAKSCVVTPTEVPTTTSAPLG